MNRANKGRRIERKKAAEQRFAVLALPREATLLPGAGVPGGMQGAEWLCGSGRAWVLRYGAGPCGSLPQPKQVRAALAAWAKGVVGKGTRVSVLRQAPSAAEIETMLAGAGLRSGVVLSYPLALPRRADLGGYGSVDLYERLAHLGGLTVSWVNKVLKECHSEEMLEQALGWGSPAYKHSGLKLPEGIPSRVGRCLQETAARLLKSQAQRRQAFLALREILPQYGPERIWEAVVAARDALADGSLSSGLLFNLAEQMVRDHERRAGGEAKAWAEALGFSMPEPWAARYVDLQGPARLSRPFLALAGDDGGKDGQVVRQELVEGEGGQLSLRCSLKLPEDADGREWEWCSFEVPCPERLREELSRGGKLLLPDLRQTRAGKWVLDLKVAAVRLGKGKWCPGRVVAFDWGLRKMLTAVVMEEGVQLSRPFFLRVGPVYAKLKELRARIDLLKKKAARLKKYLGRGAASSEAVLLAQKALGIPGDTSRIFDPGPERARQVLEKVEAEIAACWRRYSELGEELAHLASNVLLALAQATGAKVIAGEWLGSLKSREKSAALNWRINSQVRSLILEKLRYKARRYGIKVVTVWPRGTSHRCPWCQKAGELTRKPPAGPGKKESSEPGRKPGREPRKRRSCSWFRCPSCGGSGDRDYVGALNVGIEYFAEERARAAERERVAREGEKGKVLGGRALAELAAVHRQAVSYRGPAVGKPFIPQKKVDAASERAKRQQRPLQVIAKPLRGWRNLRVRLKPAVRAWCLPASA